MTATLTDAWRASLCEAFPQGARDGLLDHAAVAIAGGALLVHAGDLALAWAVGRGDPEAVLRFEREIIPEADVAARKLDRAPAFVDEVRQAVRVRLVVAEGDAPPRIAAYRGTGPLRGWVAVAALRVALNLKRAQKRAPIGDELLADVVDREPDPELRHLKTLYRAEFREALGAALASLSDRQRALLRLRYVDGLELAHVGRLYGVHESTASRWLAQAAEAVSTDARNRLVARLAIGRSSVDSVARMVASQLDLSIARLLQ